MYLIQVNKGGTFMERKELLDALVKENLTLSSMESVTGGLFAAAFTSIPGASKAFKGGLITYSNEAKIAAGVKKETIDSEGAISFACAKEMALKASTFFETDCSVSFTGNAGPDAIEDKPVGLVFIGVRVKSTIYTYKLELKGDRDVIRKQCVDFAFTTLKEKISALSSND